MSYAQSLNARIPYATFAELEFLQQAARELGPGANVVMIGAGPGVMAVAMLEANPSLNMVVVDIDDSGYAQEHVRGTGASALFITADSKEAGERWETVLDFLIVDGDHSYEGVRGDLEAWLPHLRAGGRVFIHDYYQVATLDHQPGVAQAVDEFDLGDSVQVDTAAIFMRKTLWTY